MHAYDMNLSIINQFKWSPDPQHRVPSAYKRVFLWKFICLDRIRPTVARPGATYDRQLPNGCATGRILIYLEYLLMVSV
jgi:hypothetical protein